MKPKPLFYLSLFPVGWVLVLGITYYLHFNAKWFRGISELITIPALLLGIVLLILAFLNWKKEKYRVGTYSFYSILLLTLSFILLFTS